MGINTVASRVLSRCIWLASDQARQVKQARSLILDTDGEINRDLVSQHLATVLEHNRELTRRLLEFAEPDGSPIMPIRRPK